MSSHYSLSSKTSAARAFLTELRHLRSKIFELASQNFAVLNPLICSSFVLSFSSWASYAYCTSSTITVTYLSLSPHPGSLCFYGSTDNKRIAVYMIRSSTSTTPQDHLSDNPQSSVCLLRLVMNAQNLISIVYSSTRQITHICGWSSRETYIYI